MDKKNVYISTTNKIIKIYNHKLELQNEIDVTNLVSDDFKYYLKLEYIENEKQNIVQVAPEKFYWMDSTGNLQEWQEKKEIKMSDHLIVFRMNNFVKDKESMIESKQYLLDLKQEKIVSTIEYRNNTSEKAKERSSYGLFQMDSQGNLYMLATIVSGKKIFGHKVTSETGLYSRDYIIKIEKEHLLDFLKEYNKD